MSVLMPVIFQEFCLKLEQSKGHGLLVNYLIQNCNLEQTGKTLFNFVYVKLRLRMCITDCFEFCQEY